MFPVIDLPPIDLNSGTWWIDVLIYLFGLYVGRNGTGIRVFNTRSTRAHRTSSED